MPMHRSGSPVRMHYHLSTGLGDLTNVSTRPTTLYGIAGFNNSTGVIAYLKVYDISTGISSVTSTAGTPSGVFLVPCGVSPTTVAIGAGISVQFPQGWNLTNGLSYSIVAGAADNSTVAVAAAAVIINILHDSTYILAAT